MKQDEYNSFQEKKHPDPFGTNERWVSVKTAVEQKKSFITGLRPLMWWRVKFKRSETVPDKKERPDLHLTKDGYFKGDWRCRKTWLLDIVNWKMFRHIPQIYSLIFDVTHMPANCRKLTFSGPASPTH